MKLSRRVKSLGIAFSLIETMIAISILGTLLIGLYASIGYGFQVLQLARENFRATQIMLDKTESIRLYQWDQINTPGFIPTNFSAPFFAVESTNQSSELTFSGLIQITNAISTASYKTNLRLVKVQLQWTSSGVVRTREMTTLICRDGLQRYIY